MKDGAKTKRANDNEYIYTMTFRLGKGHKDLLNNLARETNLSKSEILRWGTELVNNYVNKLKNEVW